MERIGLFSKLIVFLVGQDLVPEQKDEIQEGEFWLF